MFSRGVPTTELPPGYQLDLDRLPISGGGCSGSLLLIVILIIALAGTVGLVLWGFSATTGSSPEPTIAPSPTSPLEAIVWAPTAEATPTLDSWSLTGTALFLATPTATFTPTATQDYCQFMTPTATFTPTLIYTPDAWQMRGTEVWLEEHPPTATPEPQPTTPKSWCDLYLTPTATRTRILGTTFPTAEPTPSPTATRRFSELVNPSQPVYVYPTAAPQSFDPPPNDQQPPQLPLPTAFPTVKPTRDKPDRTPTDSGAVSPTPTATATASATPSPVPTPTATATASATPSPVPTQTPQTAAPVVVLSVNCDDGVPEFELQPIGGPVTLIYRLLLNRWPVDDGVLIVQGRQSFAFLTATDPGRYHLEVGGERIARVDCPAFLIPVPVDE